MKRHLSMAVLTGALVLAGATAFAGTGQYHEEHEKQSGTTKPTMLQRVDMRLDELTEDQVKQLQTKLTENGNYDGEINGKLDAQTREGFYAFLKSRGEEVKDKLDRATASALGFKVTEVQPVSGEDRDPQSGDMKKMTGKKLTFAVIGVDRENQMVYFKRKTIAGIAEEGENPEIWLQSGRDVAMSFAQLERAVAGTELGAKIAEELRSKDQVTIIADDKGRVISVEY